MIMLSKNINKIITTLYNAMGNKIIEELTGFKFDYKFEANVIVNTDIIKTDNPYFEIYNFIIEVNTDKRIPQFLPITEKCRITNGLPEGCSIYLGVISNEFVSLLNHIGVNKCFGTSIKVCFINTMDYISYITLESVNMVYDKNNNLFYTMNHDGSPDLTNQLNVNYEELKKEISDVDRWKLHKYLK